MSHSLVTPSTVLKQESRLIQKSIHQEKFVVDHQLGHSTEIDVPGSTSWHVIAFQLNQHPRYIRRLNGSEFDGILARGDLTVAAAGIPVFCA